MTAGDRTYLLETRRDGKDVVVGKASGQTLCNFMKDRESWRISEGGSYKGKRDGGSYTMPGHF